MQDVLIHSQRSRIVLLCNDAAMAATISEGRTPLSINNASSYGNSIQTIIGSINHYTRIPNDLPLPAHIVSAGKYIILATTANSC